MAKTSKRSTTSTKAPRTRAPKRKTLAELNAWLNANYDGVIKAARKNCMQLTGKPTFGGGGRRRKSA
jgi:hypothetical protein